LAEPVGHCITPATKIRTNPYSRFGPATADRGSRGIRDQPRNPPKYTEKRIRINFPFPCPSVLLTFKIFEACADFLTPDGLESCRKRRNFGAHRSLVQSCGCSLAALGFPWLPVCDELSIFLAEGNTSWFGQWTPDPPGVCDHRRRGEKSGQCLLRGNPPC
jgi:hypothetical protein